MTAFATQSNIDMSGPGLLGSDVAGSSRRKSKRITIGTGLTLSGGVLSNSLDLSGYVQKTSATGSLILPSGTTAERDVSPVAGYSRWNTTTSRFERWTGSIWENHVRLSGDTMTGALSLGSNGFTCGAITASGTAKFNNYSASKYWQFETGANGIFRYYSAAGPSYNFQIVGDNTGSGGSPRVMLTSGGSIEFGDNAYSLSISTMDLILKRANAGVLAQRNGINAQCFLLNKTYTSDSSQEALMLDAGKQISGKLGLYSYRGTSSGSNYPIQIGMLAADGTTFSGLTVDTSGRTTVYTPTDVASGLTFDSGSMGYYYMRPVWDGSGVWKFGPSTNSYRTRFNGMTELAVASGVSRALTANEHITFEMTSDTAGNLVYRGSDGTTRRMALLFA